MAFAYLFLYQNTYEELHLLATIIAGCFAFVALILSLFLTFQHLRSYTNPAEQKWIVAVIFMVPVYATQSILSLWNTKLSVACGVLRNCYEAFALYSFGSFLIACLGGETKVVELLECESRKQISTPLLESKKNTSLQKKSFRNFFLQPQVLGKKLLKIIKSGLVQYMILKNVCALVALLLQIFRAYGSGQFKWYYGFPYITVILICSQIWALCCLIQFYKVTHQKLKPIKPLAKFISFKAIIFATWWQGVAIVLLGTFGVLPKDGKFQIGLQDFLICIEMAIAATAHIFVFSVKPYHYVPLSQYGEVTAKETKAVVKIDEGDEENAAMLEKREMEVEAVGTSVKESVQDIVIGGGQKVVKDVVFTINQAIEPVHEGMAKIQETFHHISVSNESNDEPEVKIEEHEECITMEPEL